MQSRRPTDAALERYDEALAFLFSRIDYERTSLPRYGEREFKLDGMREFLRRLGQPQQGMPIVHLAGTKGKGSTAALIAGILSSAGYRTGLYTSPHLHGLEERFVVDGIPASREELVGLVDRVRPTVAELDREEKIRGPDHPGPTYFELTTAMALLHFANRQVDIAVLEVGMGGRLDSTNVCQPIVSVITSISFDHTKQLGNTLAAIAREKAGIVKPAVPCISGVVSPEPRDMIAAICQERQSPLVQAGVDFQFEHRPAPENTPEHASAILDFANRSPPPTWELKNLRMRMLGRHQGANAAVALATATELTRQGYHIPEGAIRRALETVACPARIEVVRWRPTIVLDAAHNLASIAALLDTLDESFQPRRRMLVFGTTRDKDVEGMLGQLLPKFDAVVLTAYASNPRAVPVDELVELVGKTSNITPQVCSDPASAWKTLQAWAAADDLVCVTGSFFLAAEMRELLPPQTPWPESAAASNDSSRRHAADSAPV